MTMKIVFAEPQLPESGALAVGVAADRVLTPAAATLDEASGGAVGRGCVGGGTDAAPSPDPAAATAPNARAAAAATADTAKRVRSIGST